MVADFEEAAIDELNRLCDLVCAEKMSDSGIIPWAQPVLAFGSPLRSQVATLGLNPSNLEFVDVGGMPLLAPNNRFETLHTLDIACWANRTGEDVRQAWIACEEYFFNQPYNKWFRPLDKILQYLMVSYYCRFMSACHLDLVPFATWKKWSQLDFEVRIKLIKHGASSLGHTLRNSSIKLLILNGASVVKAFQELAGNRLVAKEMPSWSLKRGLHSGVAGIAYQGIISKFNNVSLEKDLMVLGYNHNIQSSFGVSSIIVDKIAKWAADCGGNFIS